MSIAYPNHRDFLCHSVYHYLKDSGEEINVYVVHTTVQRFLGNS